MPIEDDITLRDKVAARLTDLFGEPQCRANVYQWSVLFKPGNAPINISVNCWRTPDEVRVWVFDPSRGDTESVHYRKVDRLEDLEVTVQAIIDYVSGRHPEK